MPSSPTKYWVAGGAGELDDARLGTIIGAHEQHEPHIQPIMDARLPAHAQGSSETPSTTEVETGVGQSSQSLPSLASQDENGAEFNSNISFNTFLDCLKNI